MLVPDQGSQEELVSEQTRRSRPSPTSRDLPRRSLDPRRPGSIEPDRIQPSPPSPAIDAIYFRSLRRTPSPCLAAKTSPEPLDVRSRGPLLLHNPELGVVLCSRIARPSTC